MTDGPGVGGRDGACETVGNGLGSGEPVLAAGVPQRPRRNARRSGARRQRLAGARGGDGRRHRQRDEILFVTETLGTAASAKTTGGYAIFALGGLPVDAERVAHARTPRGAVEGLLVASSQLDFDSVRHNELR